MTTAKAINAPSDETRTEIPSFVDQPKVKMSDKAKLEPPEIPKVAISAIGFLVII